MTKPVFSEWMDIPDNAGAWWMRHNATKMFIICQVVREPDGFRIQRAGLQGSMHVDLLRPGERSFFGPISLPNGTAFIYQNAVYREQEQPVDPL